MEPWCVEGEQFVDPDSGVVYVCECAIRGNRRVCRWVPLRAAGRTVQVTERPDLGRDVPVRPSRPLGPHCGTWGSA